MFDFSKLLKGLRKNPLNILILFFVFVFVVMLLALFIRSRNSSTTGAPITQDQIKLQRGEDIIIVNKNGLVEYRTKDKVFYETWDSSRMSSFFSGMEEKARQRANKPATNSCTYKVTLYLDGKLVTFCADENDQEVKEVYDTYDEKTGTSLSDLFSGDQGSGGGGNQDNLSDIVYFPTPTVVLNISPTPTVSQSSGSSTNYPPVKAGCDTWQASIVRNRAIISNTYCTVQPTPTP